LSQPTLDEPFASPDASFAQLVLDAAADEGVRHFRATIEAALPADIDAAGFAALRCSGSAQFSAAGWREIAARLGHPRDLHVIDLRQESHGFFGGSAVSWYARNNWGCVGLSDADTSSLEAIRLKILESSAEVLVGSSSDVKAGRPPTFQSIQRREIAAERELLGLPEGRYLRLMVTDHLGPRPEVVAVLVRFVRGLDGRPPLHFHCRGGKGRRTSFMAIYDMLCNAHLVSYEDILARNSALAGYDLGKVPAEGALKRPYIQARQALLRQVYDYARATSGGAACSWMEWLGRPGQIAELA